MKEGKIIVRSSSRNSRSKGLFSKNSKKGKKKDRREISKVTLNTYFCLDWIGGIGEQQTTDFRDDD